MRNVFDLFHRLIDDSPTLSEIDKEAAHGLVQVHEAVHWKVMEQHGKLLEATPGAA
jgi:hypothetical protein